MSPDDPFVPATEAGVHKKLSTLFNRKIAQSGEDPVDWSQMEWQPLDETSESMDLVDYDLLEETLPSGSYHFEDFCFMLGQRYVDQEVISGDEALIEEAWLSFTEIVSVDEKAAHQFYLRQYADVAGFDVDQALRAFMTYMEQVAAHQERSSEVLDTFFEEEGVKVVERGCFSFPTKTTTLIVEDAE